MKKLVISLIIAFLTLGLSGCAKTLTCEQTLNEADDGIDMTTKVIIPHPWIWKKPSWIAQRK